GPSNDRPTEYPPPGNWENRGPSPMPDPQSTVLLHHVLAAGSHYDWLIARPGHDRLWAARVTSPSAAWADLRQLDLTVLPPHRRAYRTSDGPGAGDRGRVTRVDGGHVDIEAWTDNEALLSVHMTGFAGRVRLVRTPDPTRWIAQVNAANR